MGEKFKGWLLYSDVDGTITPYKEIPRRNVEAIKRFQEEGGRFSLSTGRSRCALTDILQQVTVNAPVISINGGYVYDVATEKEIFSINLPDEMHEVTRILLERHPEVGSMLVDDGHYIIVQKGTYSVPYLEARFKRAEEPNDVYLFQELSTVTQPLKKVLFTMDPAQMESFRADARNIAPDDIEFIRTDSYQLEVMPKGINKGEGLKKAALYLGIDLCKTAAIGDQENDFEMLEIAGKSAAVEGSPKELQKKVDFIAGRCENGAVADFIEFLERTV